MRNLRLIVLVVLAGYVLYGAFEIRQMTMNHSDPDSGKGDFVSDWEKRMGWVKKRLPENVTLIGYVADGDLPDVTTNPVDQDNEYMLSQYALAPIRVVPGLEAEWILGNFTTPDFEVWLDTSLQKYEITSLGYGIYLIHRTSP